MAACRMAADLFMGSSRRRHLGDGEHWSLVTAVGKPLLMLRTMVGAELRRPAVVARQRLRLGCRPQGAPPGALPEGRPGRHRNLPVARPPVVADTVRDRV